MGFGFNGTLYVADSVGNLVETTPGGATVAVVTVDKNMGGAGNLFGPAVRPGRCGRRTPRSFL